MTAFTSDRVTADRLGIVFISDKQLAERFSVTRQTIWRWHRTDPDFPRAVTLSGGCTRFKLSEVEAWENAKAEAA